MEKKQDHVFDKIKSIRIVACGTSYHAGLIFKQWVEGHANIACDVEVASEFRYRKTVTPDNCLFVTISQSGETADTLSALRKAKYEGYIASLTICNVNNSSLVRESDLAYMTKAGIEVGVASTKAYTAQLIGLLLLTAGIAQRKNIATDILDNIQSLPYYLEKTMLIANKIETISHDFFIQRKHIISW